MTAAHLAMNVQRSSLLATGALQLVGVALTLALATHPVALAIALLAAIGGPLVLLTLPPKARPRAPEPPPLSDVRTRFAKRESVPDPDLAPPLPLQGSQASGARRS